MEHNTFVDCHVHTEYSFDSQSKMSDICAFASENGLKGLTVTDHCEICAEGTNDMWDYALMRRSYEAAHSASVENESSLKIYAGVELGQPNHSPRTAERVLKQCDYDCVLASVHYLRDGRDFCYLDYLSKEDPYEVFDSYLDEIHEVVCMDCFDVLAHITYPLRYIIGRSQIDFGQNRFYDKMDKVLSLLARNGKALEINTAGGRKNNYLVPDVRILTRFRELGGKYVTLGSDAHRAFGVGGSFDNGIALAKAAGFDSVVYYCAHKPIAVNIQ